MSPFLVRFAVAVAVMIQRIQEVFMEGEVGVRNIGPLPFRTPAAAEIPETYHALKYTTLVVGL